MKYKVIRAAAHNFGHAFVSLMNYVGDDYVMSHLARAAVASRSAELTIDLLTGDAGPIGLLSRPVAESILNHVRWFPKHLSGEGVEIDRIRRAAMVVTFALQGTVAGSGRRPPWTVPFECVVTVEDDRGEVHEGRVRALWHVYD